MEDAFPVQPGEAVAGPLASQIDLAFEYDGALRRAAVAQTARIFKAAAVDARDRVKVLDKLLQRIAPLVKALRNAAHDHAGGVEHDQHVPDEALPGYGNVDQAVAVLVHITPGVRLSALFRLPAHGNQRGVGALNILLRLSLDDGVDFLLTHVEPGQEADGAGLPGGEDEQISRRRGGPLQSSAITP